MRKAGHGSKMEAAGMYSSEGEYVEFGNPVLLDGTDSILKVFLIFVRRLFFLIFKLWLRTFFYLLFQAIQRWFK